MQGPRTVVEDMKSPVVLTDPPKPRIDPCGLASALGASKVVVLHCRDRPA